MNRPFSNLLLLGLPTLGILYSFLTLPAPKSLLFRESHHREGAWLDLYFDVNPKGFLRSEKYPVSFAGYFTDGKLQQEIRGEQFLHGGKAKYQFDAPPEITPHLHALVTDLLKGE